MDRPGSQQIHGGSLCKRALAVPPVSPGGLVLRPPGHRNCRAGQELPTEEEGGDRKKASQRELPSTRLAPDSTFSFSCLFLRLRSLE